jgi:hypothetical protein
MKTFDAAFLSASLLLAIVLAHNSSARIGDTKAELEKRYGKPYRTDVQQTWEEWDYYNHSNFQVTVELLHGKSAYESFSPSTNRFLEDKECESLGQYMGQTNAWDGHYTYNFNELKKVVTTWTMTNEQFRMVRHNPPTKTESVTLVSKENDTYWAAHATPLHAKSPIGNTNKP